jgi:hypothetical protein
VLTRQRRTLIHLILAALIGDALLDRPAFVLDGRLRQGHPAPAPWETLWALGIGIGIALLLDLGVRFVRSSFRMRSDCPRNWP